MGPHTEEPAQRRSEVARLNYEASITEAADRLRFQQEIGLTACKSVILVNGGAIVGMLSFIGNHARIAHPDQLKNAVIGFCIGISFGLLSLYFSYIGQDWLSDFRTSVAWNYQQDMMDQPRIHDVEKERKRGWHLMLIASALVMAGIGMFIFGAVTAANAILG